MYSHPIIDAIFSSSSLVNFPVFIRWENPGWLIPNCLANSVILIFAWIHAVLICSCMVIRNHSFSLEISYKYNIIQILKFQVLFRSCSFRFRLLRNDRFFNIPIYNFRIPYTLLALSRYCNIFHMVSDCR